MIQRRKRDAQRKRQGTATAAWQGRQAKETHACACSAASPTTGGARPRRAGVPRGWPRFGPARDGRVALAPPRELRGALLGLALARLARDDLAARVGAAARAPRARPPRPRARRRTTRRARARRPCRARVAPRAATRARARRRRARRARERVERARGRGRVLAARRRGGGAQRRLELGGASRARAAGRPPKRAATARAAAAAARAARAAARARRRRAGVGAARAEHAARAAAARGSASNCAWLPRARARARARGRAARADLGAHAAAQQRAGGGAAAEAAREPAVRARAHLARLCAAQARERRAPERRRALAVPPPEQLAQLDARDRLARRDAALERGLDVELDAVRLSFFQRRKLAPAAFHSCFDTSRTSAGAPSRLARSAWSRSRNALPAGRVAASGGPRRRPRSRSASAAPCCGAAQSRCFVLIAHRTHQGASLQRERGARLSRRTRAARRARAPTTAARARAARARPSACRAGRGLCARASPARSARALQHRPARVARTATGYSRGGVRLRWKRAVSSPRAAARRSVDGLADVLRGLVVGERARGERHTRTAYAGAGSGSGAGARFGLAGAKPNRQAITSVRTSSRCRARRRRRERQNPGDPGR